MLLGGVEVIDAGAPEDDAAAEFVTVPLLPELTVEPGVAVPLEADAEPVMLGRLDELEGAAELLPVAEADAGPETAEDPSKLGNPVTTTEVG